MSTDAFKLAMSGLHTYFISNWVFMVDFCCRLFHILTVFRYLLLLSCLGQLYAALWELLSGKFIRNSHLATFWFSLFGLRIEAIRSSTTLFIDIVRIAKVSWIQFKRLDCEKWTNFVPSLHWSLLSKTSTSVKIIHQILEASLIYSDESGYNEFDSVFLANYLKLSAYCVETGPLWGFFLYTREV
jgi:hypothetical protein